MSSSAYQWLVTHSDIDSMPKSRTVDTLEAALERAQFLRKQDVYRNIRIWRRPLAEWEPVCQSEFPGDRS